MRMREWEDEAGHVIDPELAQAEAEAMYDSIRDEEMVRAFEAS